jgi:hypothetical protein
MKFLHMSKELNVFRDWVLSHKFPTWKSSHTRASMKTKQSKRRERDGTHLNEDVIWPGAIFMMIIIYIYIFHLM